MPGEQGRQPKTERPSDTTMERADDARDLDTRAWATDMNDDAATAEATPNDQENLRIREEASLEGRVSGEPPNVSPDVSSDAGTTFPRETIAGPWTPQEGDRPYFPPTDPVVKPNPASTQGLEVLGGMEPTAMDDVGLVGEEETGVMPGDDQVQSAVVRELREDAMTTDLHLQVLVKDGDVTLRGRVSSLEESDAALEVAGRVEGVGNVLDEIAVEGLTDRKG